MMWSLHSVSDTSRLATCLAALLVAGTVSCAAQAQEPVALSMKGDETIDPKERISGDATVGINFVQPNEDDDATEFDIDGVYAYFYDEPVAPLRTQLTTVDGRYYAKFDTPESDIKKGEWARLELTLRTDQPLSTDFLVQNYDHAGEIAILVTDSSKPTNKSFPVRLGSWCATEHVRIRVNAEGADAYVVKFTRQPDGTSKGALARCNEASDKPQFKFDHNCDMALTDIGQLETLQVIRKRGSTYEKSIPIALGAFTTNTANGERNCGE